MKKKNENNDYMEPHEYRKSLEHRRSIKFIKKMEKLFYEENLSKLIEKKLQEKYDYDLLESLINVKIKINYINIFSF